MFIHQEKEDVHKSGGDYIDYVSIFFSSPLIASTPPVTTVDLLQNRCELAGHGGLVLKKCPCAHRNLLYLSIYIYI